jgi:hypothetical protein
MVRGDKRSSVRGALYESTSIAAVYGTICSLRVVWESRGRAPRTLVREYPETSGENSQSLAILHEKPVKGEKRKNTEGCEALLRADLRFTGVAAIRPLVEKGNDFSVAGVGMRWPR